MKLCNVLYTIKVMVWYNEIAVYWNVHSAYEQPYREEKQRWSFCS